MSRTFGLQSQRAWGFPQRYALRPQAALPSFRAPQGATGSFCALCMSGAIVDDVPTDEYDRRVDAICTKDEFITIE
ncbi:MAG: hypothetical protein LBS82_03780 [Spirochaetaceae bacterium]|nr:hypothetical protein [Spirochaetaceae bacterium]